MSHMSLWCNHRLKAWFSSCRLQTRFTKQRFHQPFLTFSWKSIVNPAFRLGPSKKYCPHGQAQPGDKKSHETRINRKQDDPTFNRERESERERETRERERERRGRDEEETRKRREMRDESEFPRNAQRLAFYRVSLELELSRASEFRVDKALKPGWRKLEEAQDHPNPNISISSHSRDKSRQAFTTEQ